MTRIRIHEPDLWVSANQTCRIWISATLHVTGKMLTIQAAEELEIGGLAGVTDAALITCSTSTAILRP